ncbi:hypothetical protein V8E54_014803 [Elaphomyces granulatus]
MDTLEYPVRPICQPKPHYSLVNYSSSEDDFVTVLDDEDDNEGDENDENEEEGVEDEGFDRAWQNAIDVYGPLTDEDFDQAIDDYSPLADEDFDQGQNAMDDYSLLADEDFDQGQNAMDDDSLFANDPLPLFSSSDSDEDERPRHRADLPPPPEDIYTTPDEAIAAINSFATVHGYAVSVKRSVKKKDVLKHVYYQCVRGGKFRARVDERS